MIRPWSIASLVWTWLIFATDCGYPNRVPFGNFRDPSVVRVGHEYFATATESGWARRCFRLHTPLNLVAL
jgi:hypothetical protein